MDSEQSDTGLGQELEHPWRDEDLMRRLYNKEELTHKEIGERLGCSQGTVSRWMENHGIEARNSTKQKTGGPWRDKELIQILYVDNKWSASKISKAFDCSPNTIKEWVEKHGFERRKYQEAVKLANSKYENAANYYTDDRGYEAWKHKDHYVPVHRLQMVAEYGLDAVRGYHVHHINGNSWDNRIDNLELLTNEEHRRKHLKVDGIDRIRVAEFYEHGDISSRDLAEMFDISSATVLGIRDEFYGDSDDN